MTAWMPSRQTRRSAEGVPDTPQGSLKKIEFDLLAGRSCAPTRRSAAGPRRTPRATPISRRCGPLRTARRQRRRLLDSQRPPDPQAERPWGVDPVGEALPDRRPKAIEPRIKPFAFHLKLPGQGADIHPLLHPANRLKLEFTAVKGTSLRGHAFSSERTVPYLFVSYPGGIRLV